MRDSSRLQIFPFRFGNLTRLCEVVFKTLKNKSSKVCNLKRKNLTLAESYCIGKKEESEHSFIHNRYSLTGRNKTLFNFHK